MVPPKDQLSVNIPPDPVKSRVKFSQFTWPALVWVAIWVGVARGAPLWLGLLIGFIFCLPTLVWGVSKARKTVWGSVSDDFYIISWALIALLGMSLGGGALSPLTAVLVLGPMASMTLGRFGIVSHAALLGLLAYVIAIVAGAFGWSNYVPSAWQEFAAPLAVGALVQAVVFALSIQALLMQAKESETNGVRPAPTQNGKPETVSAGVAPVQAEFDLPLLLIEIAPEGRIKRLEGGADLRWPGLKAGEIAQDALGDMSGQTYTSPKGDDYSVLRKDRPDGGVWIGLLQPATDPAELEALKVALKEAHDKAGEVEQALSDRTAFFAGLGHDLKTPLNAILGFADLMKAEVRGPMPDGYKDYPAIIHESGQDLMLLVDDILDLAKAEASGHRLDLEPVDLVASAGSVMRQLEDQAERSQVKLSLKTEDEVWAEADARAVRQIWQNLISNAIKYSDSGGVVTLWAGKAAGSVALSVKDRGAGMSQSDLERIAKPFMQGDNAKGRAGTGLGLAVVQRFAELHGGKVVIETEKGKGTLVRVTLPALDTDLLEEAAQ